MAVITVSQLNRYVAARLKEDRNLSSLFVKGEIVNLRYSDKSRMYYLGLTDGDAKVDACIFASDAARLKKTPENGMSIVALCSVGLYEKFGSYQIYIRDIMPTGLGKKQLDLIALKERLMQKGYFAPERKKAIPAYPEKIGVVTSWDGAAIRDIVRILSDKYPVARLYVFDTLVQGAAAEKTIVSGLKAADRGLPDAGALDLVILARGGGSKEDLDVFNSEKIADALFEMRTPVIAAVGHEIDVTIADLTADLRVPTPTAAAELFSVAGLDGALVTLGEHIRSVMEGEYDKLAEKTELYTRIFSPTAMINSIDRSLMALDVAKERLGSGLTASLDRLSDRLQEAEKSFDAYWESGSFSLEKAGARIFDIKNLGAGDEVDIVDRSGNRVRAKIIKV